MKHMQTVTVPAQQREFVHHTTCDICGARIREPQQPLVDDITVSRKVGYNEVYQADGTEVAFDLCGDCFDNKLVPWLKSQGAEPRPEGWGW